MPSKIATVLASVVVLLTVGCGLSIPGAEAADTAPPAVIVLDGSGSMGGPLEGQKDVKFDLASKAILDLLPQAAAASRTGLVTFGNRRRSDCSDVETAITPAAGNLDQFKTVFSKIGPVGRGPLVAGVQEARKIFPPGSAGTLIIIHDGVDNCRQDVCALAADISKSNPKLVIHSIPISLDKTVAERMTCVANLTGGTVYEARDGLTVASALKDALSKAGIIGLASSASDETAGAVSPAVDPKGPPSLRLSAVLSKGGPTLTSPITWRVMPGADPSKVLKDGKVPVLAAEVPEGNYIVEAQYGLARGKTMVDVASEGPTTAQIDLQAGVLNITSAAAKSDAQGASSAVIISSIKSGDGALSPLVIARVAETELILPAGQYRVEAGNGLASKLDNITLEPGAKITVDIGINTGRLELSAVSNEGGPVVDGATFIISTDDPDTADGRREIARSSAPAPDFTLPAGTYYVTVKAGASEVKERIAVGTGDVVKRAVVMNGTWVSLLTAHDGGVVLDGEPVVFRVFPKDAPKDGSAERLISERSEIGGSAANVFLPAGSYRIEASIGRQNVKGEALTEIGAGPPTTVPVKFSVSEVIVRPPSDAAVAASLYWEIRDQRGRIVQRSAGALAEKVLLMAPGPYVLTSETGDKSQDVTLELRPGDKRTVTLH